MPTGLAGTPAERLLAYFLKPFMPLVRQVKPGDADTMFERAKRVGQLVSSNVESLLDKASDPRKLLLLLRAEIEDSIVSLQGERSRAQRKAERLAEAAKAKAAVAEEWTAKAKVAVDKGREDLARAALLARESDRTLAAELKADAEAAKAELGEIDTAMAELETKRAEALARLDAMPAPARAADKPAAPASRTESRLDGVEAMEKRMDFSAQRPADLSPADVDAEIARMEQESAIEAEIAAMAGKAGSGGKARGKTRKG